MQHAGADFTLTFRRLAQAAENPREPTLLRALFAESPEFDGWLREWQERLAGDPQSSTDRVADMRAANPAFIPRNHRVQAALDAAERGDYTLFRKLLGILQRPYEDQPEVSEYGLPPQPSERVLQTFCGT
jgi:uncharacterized protein YdiU (UPF0061 family)